MSWTSVLDSKWFLGKSSKRWRYSAFLLNLKKKNNRISWNLNLNFRFLLKLCSKLRLNRFWVEIWRRKPSFSVKCGFLLKLSLKHTLTHNFNIKFNLKIIDLCELRRHFSYFFQRNPWILRIGNKFFDNFDKILPFYRKPEILRPFSRFFGCFS